jgi:GH35 family endo-1,4-beta-xylanase
MLTFFVALIAAGVQTAQPPRSLLPAGNWTLVRPAEADARLERGSPRGLPAGTAEPMKVTVLRPSEPFYLIMLTRTIAPDVPQGTRIRLTFWARSATRNPLRAVLEKATAPYTPVAEIFPTLQPEWKRYTVVGTTPGYGPDGLGVRFQMGHQAGEVDIAGVTVEDIGRDPAPQEVRRKLTPEAIRTRIEQHRMGELVVEVRDSRNRPVRGATVKVEQQRHAFLFGCNIFELRPEDSSPTQLEYQRRFKELLNFATLPFYWGSVEPTQGAPQYARLEAMARWCRENGITPKGHPLIWHEVWPGWAPSDPDQTIPLLEARVREIIPRFKDLITIWDVLNECNNAATYVRTGQGQWVRRDGPARVVETALRWAREASKGIKTTLLYNDFNISDANVELLRELQARKALPDAIGIQSHMHGGTWPEEQIWTVAERFAQFGVPVHFTEATVISGPPRPVDFQSRARDWHTTPEDEERQARYVERFYTILFSHPKVHAITWWDFSDRAAWLGAPAGLLRADMSPKPAYDRLMKLIKGEWWTRAALTTNQQGAAKARVYYGTHRVEASTPSGLRGSATIEMPMGSGSRRVTVRIGR